MEYELFHDNPNKAPRRVFDNPYMNTPEFRAKHDAAIARIAPKVAKNIARLRAMIAEEEAEEARQRAEQEGYIIMSRDEFDQKMDELIEECDREDEEALKGEG